MVETSTTYKLLAILAMVYMTIACATDAVHATNTLGVVFWTGSAFLWALVTIRFAWVFRVVKWRY